MYLRILINDGFSLLAHYFIQVVFLPYSYLLHPVVHGPSGAVVRGPSGAVVQASRKSNFFRHRGRSTL